MAGSTKIASLVLGGAALAIGCVQPIPSEKAVKKTPQERILELDKSLKKHNHPDKIDLEIIIDSEFIKKHDGVQQDWMEKLFDHIDFVEDRFDDLFDIDLEVDSVKYLELPENAPPDIFFLYNYLHIKYKNVNSDLIILFSGKDCGREQGICKKLGSYVVVAPRLSIPVKRVFQHEVSHLYGADDVHCSRTIMSNDVVCFSYNWSDTEQTIIDLNRHKDWEDIDEWHFEMLRGNINSFPEEDREDLAVLCAFANASREYPAGISLGEKLFKKYPGNMFIQDCLNAVKGE